MTSIVGGKFKTLRDGSSSDEGIGDGEAMTLTVGQNESIGLSRLDWREVDEVEISDQFLGFFNLGLICDSQ